jgi:predicted kinase
MPLPSRVVTSAEGSPAPTGTAVTGAPPCLLVAGAPASGKTTLGRALASRLGAALVDIDVATQPLTAVVAGLLREDDLDAPRLAGATRGARYETVTALAEDNLRLGRPVVLVAPFTAERRQVPAWERLAGRLRAAGGSPALVWLRLDRELLGERLRGRAAERDRAKLAGLAGFLDRVPLGPPAGPHLAVDAAADLDTQCATVLTRLA